LRDTFLGNSNSLSTIFKKMDEMVPKNLIKSYVGKCTQNNDEYYLLRKNFILSFGMESFYSYIVANEMSIENMFFNKKTGNFLYYNMKPNFVDSMQSIKPNLYSALRLSKNVENFITPMGLEGPFASTFISSSMALSKPDYGINTLLHLYIRDSLVKLEQEDNQKMRTGEYEEGNRVRIGENAEEIIQRIHSFYYEKNNDEEISEKIYNIITELTSQNYRKTVPLKFKNWF